MGNRSKNINLHFSKILKNLRINNHLTQAQVGKIVNKGESTVRMWELRGSEPDYETINLLANYFNVSVDYLLGREQKPLLDEVELNDKYPIPLLGSVVAGVPIESQQDLEGYVYISYRPAEEYFALRVHGDSMKNAGITDKCIIICHKQETAESGEIVVAMLNGEQTVKRYKVHGNSIFLMPENPEFLPIPVTPTDDFLILGKVVEYRGMF